MTYRVEPLGEHDLSSFDCGNDPLTEWLQRSARQATGQGTRTYLLIGQDEAIVGYFSLVPHFLGNADVPKRIGRGAPREIPALLLAKLALGQSVPGQGLGSELLVYALGTILEAARRAGGRLVVVDAIDDNAVAFYRHHNFQPIPDDPHRLLLKLSTVAKALDVDWP